MICTAVFEKADKTRELLREWLVRYLVQAGREMNLLWFTEDFTEERLKKYAKMIHFALISLNDESGEKTGKLLYRLNPECRICYYRTDMCALLPLLPTRPAAFFLQKDAKNEEEFQGILTRILEELTESEDIFSYEGRKGLYCIPLSHIRYLQSDRKHVLVYTDSGEEDLRFFSRLSIIERRLDGRFVRIHKSYIVNSRFVRSLEKREHVVRLSDGEELPVSDAYYEKALAKFREIRG